METKVEIHRFYAEAHNEDEALALYNTFYNDFSENIRTINVRVYLLGFGKHAIEAYYETWKN